MKLDEKYFKGKVDLVCGKFKGLHVVNTRILGNVLKQIARDGAEAQKVADQKAVNKLEIYTIHINANKSGCGLLMGDVDAAINSATVKWEVPGE